MPDVDGMLSPADLAEQSDNVRKLWELLDGIDASKREVFIMAELQELTCPEIAKALNIPLNTAYSRLRHARKHSRLYSLVKEPKGGAMSEDLSKEANELVREGQIALRPTAADKSRIALALQAKLQAAEETPEAGPEAPEAATTPTTGAPWLGKVVALTSGVVISVAAVSYLLNPSPNRAAQELAASVSPAAFTAPDISTTAFVVAPEGKQETTPPVVAATEAANTGASGKLMARSTTGDRLAEEAALLSEAEKAFHAGNFNRALALTNQHRTTFPKGLLARERVHLRVQALCGLGRQDDADKELARWSKLGATAGLKACERAP